MSWIRTIADVAGVLTSLIVVASAVVNMVVGGEHGDNRFGVFGAAMVAGGIITIVAILT